MLIYLKFHRIEFTWFHYSLTCTYFLLHLSLQILNSIKIYRRVLPAMLLYGVRTFLSLVLRRGNDKAVCGAKIIKVRSWKLEVGSFFMGTQFEQIFKISLISQICVEKVVGNAIYKLLITFNFSLLTFHF